MILVDTSIWIDHLHATEPELAKHLGDGEAGSHPAVIEELALGSIKDRAQVLALVDRRGLWGRGLSAVDAHLLGSVALVPAARLWTRDKRLRAASRELGLGWVDG